MKKIRNLRNTYGEKHFFILFYLSFIILLFYFIYLFYLSFLF